MLGKVSSNSKADIFEAKIAAALDDADSSSTGSMIEDDESLCDLLKRFNQRRSLAKDLDRLGRHFSHQVKHSFRDIVEPHQQEKIKEGLRESTDEDEQLIADYPVTLDGDFGNMFMSKSNIYFLGVSTTLTIRFEEVLSIDKEKNGVTLTRNIAIRTCGTCHVLMPSISDESSLYDTLVAVWKRNHQPEEDASLAQPQVTCYVCGASITINRRRDWQ
jgi:hypothetical protein